MPSDVSMKISKAYYEGTLKLHPPIVNILAEHLDSMGVGDAFEYVKQCTTGHQQPCICAACIALRKAGMV